MKNASNIRVLLLVSVVSILSLVASGCGSSSNPPPPAPAPVADTAVFIADKDIRGNFEIYSYVASTGLVGKLNTTMAPDGNVVSFAISPNNVYVAYVSDPVTDGKFDLYVTKIDGSGTPVLVSDVSGEVADDDVAEDDIVWAPDSSRVAYRSDEATGTAFFNLRTVMPDGNGNVAINASGTGNMDVAAFSIQWAPNSSRVAYLSDVNGAWFDLYTSTPTTSAGAANISVLAAGMEVSDYSWAPNSSKLLYRSDGVVVQRFELFTNDPIGGAQVAISGDLSGADLDVSADSGVWAPDSSRVAYVADGTTDGVFTAYTSLPTGIGSPIRINRLLADGDVDSIPSWAPDSSRVAFVGDLTVDGTYELYTSLPMANNTTTVNQPLLGGSVEVGPIAPGNVLVLSSPPPWSPNSAFLAYIAEQDTAGSPQVYAGDPAGGPVTVALSVPANNIVELGPAEDVWASDSSKVLFAADIYDANTRDLFVASSNGNAYGITPKPANIAGVEDGWQWTATGTAVVYSSAQNRVGEIELFSSSADGSTNTAISGVMVATGDVSEFDLAP